MRGLSEYVYAGRQCSRVGWEEGKEFLFQVQLAVRWKGHEIDWVAIFSPESVLDELPFVGVKLGIL